MNVKTTVIEYCGKCGKVKLSNCPTPQPLMKKPYKSCQFNTLGIIGKYGDNDVSETIKPVLSLIDRLGCHALIDRDTSRGFFEGNTHHQTVDVETIAKAADLIIAVGGDGSFLASGRSIIEHDKPITGVNMGRLGFLTDVSPNEIDTVLRNIILGDYTCEARSVLLSTVIRNGEVIAENVAINDVVIHKRLVARMIELNVYLNDQFLSAYRADGLIVATPTGSTAYALSSGGPILQSNLCAFLLLPISPHTLTQRPIVVDANTEQRIEITPNNQNMQISIDGQEEVLLQTSDTILIKKHPKKLKICHPSDYDLLKRLRKKLNWGSEPST